MARRQIVSRTMTCTSCKYMWVDITTGKTGTETSVLFGKIPSRESVLRKLRKKLDKETFKIVAVLEYKLTSQPRYMDAEKFFEESQIMPLRSAGKEG